MNKTVSKTRKTRKRQYFVSVIRYHEREGSYRVTADSEEEAIAIVDDAFNDGDEGYLADSRIETIAALDSDTCEFEWEITGQPLRVLWAEKALRDLERQGFLVIAIDPVPECVGLDDESARKAATALLQEPRFLAVREDIRRHAEDAFWQALCTDIVEAYAIAPPHLLTCNERRRP